jgi:hypothetical protein
MCNNLPHQLGLHKIARARGSTRTRTNLTRAHLTRAKLVRADMARLRNELIPSSC